MERQEQHAGAAEPPRITVTCRQDPISGRRIFKVEPPLADGHVFDEDWLRLQPGDTLRLKLIVGSP